MISNPVKSKIQFGWVRIKEALRVVFWGKRRRWRVMRVIVWVSILILGVFSYVTNPFVRFNVVADDYVTIEQGEDGFVVAEPGGLFLRQDPFFNRLAVAKSGWHILANKLSANRKIVQASVDEIVRAIHQLRFDPEEPYLISGDHFSMFYPRSLGVFYHSILDSRTVLDAQDWQNRQLIYLKSTAYALRSFAEASKLSTTIVPVGPRSVALIDFHAYPSDTMYSLLFALDVLSGSDYYREIYPFGDATSSARLATVKVGNDLLEKFEKELKFHLKTYLDYVVDPVTGMVREEILLSGTKDTARRRSSFYDNVILWRTYQLANKLGVETYSQEFLDELKTKIMNRFWLDGEGYFLDHLSDTAVENKYYSSDWLVVQMTGFMDAGIESDRQKLVRVVDYIQRNALDQPFGLQYQPNLRSEELYRLVRWSAPEYGATAIWSNWGMEYVKLLVRLAQVTGDPIYLSEADRQLSAYAFNIKRYRGYPEVYNQYGDLFKSRFYESVRVTGWVVSFEQAEAMYRWTRQSMFNDE